MSSSSLPKDGPATNFEADPYLRMLVNNILEDTSSKGPDDDSFSLVLVVGWPPNLDEIGHPYRELKQLVQKCFDESDVNGPDAAVYFNPPECLHITVATLHSHTLDTKGSETRQKLNRHWTKVVRAAAKRSTWPKVPLQIHFESSQIGSRAGILLWKETTGGIHAMRQCIIDEVHTEREFLIHAGIDPSTLMVPNIVHSTYLRFNKVPVTPAHVVQSRYSEFVVPKLKQLFSEKRILPEARLACELVPFMHFPNDSEHVLGVFELK
jgi:hypothetical protein